MKEIAKAEEEKEESEKYEDVVLQTQDSQEKTPRSDFVLNQTFRFLMITAALLVSLSHGANDVANSISPLVDVFKVYGNESEKAKILGSLGISLGFTILGYKVMETLGSKVVKLDFEKGFAA